MTDTLFWFLSFSFSDKPRSGNGMCKFESVTMLLQWDPSRLYVLFTERIKAVKISAASQKKGRWSSVSQIGLSSSKMYMLNACIIKELNPVEILM
jgi:hypothetical protein